MKATKVGAAIEGKRLDLSTRKFIPVPPIIHPQLKQKVFRFRLQIFGKGKITEELEPKKAVVDKKSRLSLNDEIRGESIFGLSGKPIKPELVAGATSKHKGTAIVARRPGFAKIEVGVRAQLQKKAADRKSRKGSSTLARVGV